MKPRLLDLFCGAGGASRGYQLAGFHVTGVDVAPQPNYCGDAFHQADAMTFPLDGYDAIHASPPCQRFIRGGTVNKAVALDLLTPTRRRLEQQPAPWVIENVPGAPMRADVVLCGSMFGLAVRRHRWFETDPPMVPWTLSCDHSRRVAGVYGNPHGDRGAWPGMLPSDTATWQRAMGIDWMAARELAQAIPPAYTEHIGGLLVATVERAAA